MNKINLLEPNSDENTSVDDSKNSFAINVDDHDVSLPDDLGSNENSSAMGSGFDLMKYKNWLFVLGGTILIFIAVIFSLNSTSTEIQERIETTEVAIDEDDEQDSLPSFFMGSLATLPGQEAPDLDTTAGEIDDTADSILTDDDDFLSDDFFAGFDDDDFLSDDFFTGFDDDEDDLDFNDDPFGFDFADQADSDELFGSSDTSPSETVVEDDRDDEAADLEALFGRIDDIGQTFQEEPFSEGPNLNSNTTPEALMSGQMQGDTGPVIWLALIPSFAYAIVRRRRS